MLGISLLIITSILLVLTILYVTPYNGAIYILFYVLEFLGIYLSIIIIYILFIVITCLFISLKKDYKKPNKFLRFIMYITVDYVIRLIRINPKIKNAHLIPKKASLIVQNHLNATDPVISMEGLHKYGDIVFMSKKENFKIPLLGKYMWRSCFQALDRDNPRSAIKTINECARLIAEENINVGVYPEGTRNYTDDYLLDFKDGCFKIALKAKCPIIVTTIRNSPNLFKGWPFKSAGTIITVCKVIEYEEFKDLNTKEISELVRNYMILDLKK